MKNNFLFLSFENGTNSLLRNINHFKKDSSNISVLLHLIFDLVIGTINRSVDIVKKILEMVRCSLKTDNSNKRSVFRKCFPYH